MAGRSSIQRRDRREDSPFPSADDPEIIGPILDSLDAPDEVRRLAVDIASTVESTMWVVGKRRSSVAAASVYVAGILEGEAEPLFKQREVADASSASIGSIINHHQDVRRVYESASK